MQRSGLASQGLPDRDADAVGAEIEADNGLDGFSHTLKYQALPLIGESELISKPSESKATCHLSSGF